MACKEIKATPSADQDRRKTSGPCGIEGPQKTPKALAAIIERYFEGELARIKPEQGMPGYERGMRLRVAHLRESVVDLVNSDPNAERLFRLIEKSSMTEKERMSVVESVSNLLDSPKTKGHLPRAFELLNSCFTLSDVASYLRQMNTIILSHVKLDFGEALDMIERQIKEAG